MLPVAKIAILALSLSIRYSHVPIFSKVGSLLISKSLVFAFGYLIANGLFILVAGGLGMVIPTPTGIGSYHYLVIQALMIINISKEVAQFFAIIVHTSQAIMIIVAGFVGMALLYQKKKENAEA